MLLGEVSKDLLTRPLTRNEVFAVLLRLTVFGTATYFSIKWVSDALDPTRKQRIQLKKKAEHLMKQIGVEGVKLAEHEMIIAAHLVVPKDIKVTWKDIAGLDEMVSELQDTVIMPFQQQHLLQHSRLCQPPRDAFLRNRSEADHEATAMMKAEFMSLWDGLETGTNCQVMVLGATNRPQDVDPAILRRMPTTFQVGLPTQRQRQDILKLILAGENMSNAVNLKELAEKTKGYSGSDLRELCRDAAMYRVRDYVRKQQMKQIARMLHDTDIGEERDLEEERLRPLTHLDLLFALEKMEESKGVSTAVPTLEEPALD
nr:ATPase family AAA domain-containing protein 1-like isoform X1 [Zootoca vivipara]XP_034995337.1 ATPase family AAA domain-containing protein 1-like isoform X1 [Zootoca vivipara]